MRVCTWFTRETTPTVNTLRGLMARQGEQFRRDVRRAHSTRFSPGRKKSRQGTFHPETV
jgi:hypothetical protein